MMNAGSAGLIVLRQGWKPVRGETPVPRWLDAQRDSPAPRSGETPKPTGTWMQTLPQRHHLIRPTSVQRLRHRTTSPGPEALR